MRQRLTYAGIFDESTRTVDDFVKACFLLAETLWDELYRLADGSPPPQAYGALLRCLSHTMRAAVHGYQQEFQAVHTEERQTTGAVVRALVGGDDPSDIPHRFGVRPASSYTVLALQFATHPTESIGDVVGQRLAERRKVHWLSEQLTATFGKNTLSELEPERGLVLIPSDPDHSTGNLNAVRAAIPKLQDTAGIDITVGLAHATDLPSIPAARTQAQNLLQLARTPGEVAILDDYLFEYHQNHDSAALPYLRTIVDALHGAPDLLSTIATYFSNDFNRRQTARQLHVHPNTVDNRLTRITETTGVNPRTATGLMILGASLKTGDGTC